MEELTVHKPLIRRLDGVSLTHQQAQLLGELADLVTLSLFNNEWKEVPTDQMRHVMHLAIDRGLAEEEIDRIQNPYTLEGEETKDDPVYAQTLD